MSWDFDKVRGRIVVILFPRKSWCVGLIWLSLLDPDNTCIKIEGKQERLLGIIHARKGMWILISL